MPGRQRVCIVERLADDGLEGRVTAFCRESSVMVQRLSCRNAQTHCYMAGKFLTSIELKLEGYFHLDENTIEAIVGLGDRAFGTCDATVVVDPATSKHSLLLTCSYHRAPRSRFVGARLLCYSVMWGLSLTVLSSTVRWR